MGVSLFHGMGFSRRLSFALYMMLHYIWNQKRTENTNLRQGSRVIAGLCLEFLSASEFKWK